MSERIEFDNPEYQADGGFEKHHYVYEGDSKKGWRIERDGVLQQELGPGYAPVYTKYCGVCSTDLARRFLPYPLPQIIGHEVVGQSADHRVVVEINASEYARQVHSGNNPYDDASMHTHDPQRITLGIDRLPGGFAPVLLAPLDAIVPVPESVSARVAALTEPFAAALQGVEATLPRNGDRVAVLGPRRLGALIISALAGVRKSRGLEFEIIALARHDNLLELSIQLGADEAIDLRKSGSTDLKKYFDIVFDTTGKPEGFALAIEMARRTVHLKSTNGQKVEGLQFLTDLVVDEIALVAYSTDRLDFCWPGESKGRPNHYVYVAPGVPFEIIKEIEATGRRCIQGPVKEIYARMIANGPIAGADFLQDAPFPRFDLAIASNLKEVDGILRPEPGREIALVRARGAILLMDVVQNPNSDAPEAKSKLWQAIVKRDLSLQSSRCGNFERALNILELNPEIANSLEHALISHIIPLNEIEQAFAIAADSKASIKVLVQTD